MLVEEITDEQLNVFSIIERVVSVFSLLGCLFIITTFCMSRSFHKPINRLVFYASIGNMMTNVATLMARTYVEYGSSAACQFQGFLIQMFMPADAFWTMAMAVNVYLTFYFKYDAQKLRKMELPYLLFCYGIPFVVALTYIFVDDSKRGRMYGNATLWCWVQQTWDVWRIATFYGPVWVTIAITFFIYIRAGGEIYDKHKQLKDLNYTSHYEPEPLPINDPFNSKTTEVSVTVETNQEGIDLSPLDRCRVGRHSSIANGQSSNPGAYSVTISAQPPSAGDANSPTTTATANSSDKPAATAPAPTATAPPPPPPPTAAGTANLLKSSRRRANYDAHNAAWSYTKCALLFFTAMLVTWIPSSANRVYSVVKNGEVSLALEYMSAFVLPLQGFWNAIIYMTTSWRACQMLAEDLGAALFKKRSGGAEEEKKKKNHHNNNSSGGGGGGLAGVIRSRSRMGGGVVGVGGTRHGAFGKSTKSSETESMEELATRNGSISS